ncbi:MAG: isochorismatase family cysteine hydrolase [Mycobacterium sp.]|nr:isochorismatase family cysteine hydrolase [Mycobacterium sp.]
MTVINQVADRAMRALVAARMRRRARYPAATAVLVVAPQQDLLTGAAPNLAQLLIMSRAAHLTVIYAPMARPAVDWAVQTPSQRTISDHDSIRAGSPGATIHPHLRPAPDDTVLTPFAGLSAFTNTALSETLATAHLDHVIIAGCRTDIEVDSTARDATEAGLHTTVVSDCCVGSSPQGHRATVTTTLPRLIHAVLTLDDLAGLLP